MENKTAIAKRETIDVVQAKVRDFQNKGELFFPENYVPENALKSAWLMLQETKDRNDKLALEVCTKESIANSLLSMVVQGLNPDKKQCYFIVYGGKLQMQRSYFGSMAVAKMVNENIEDIYGLPVYEGDEFEYEIRRGKRFVTKHTQKLENVKKDKILAAYACIVYKDGREEYTIMPMDEIKQAWKQSKMNPIDEKGNVKAGSTHDKFTAEMCVKTVINRICKPIINSSSDSNIVARYAKRTDDDAHEAEVEEEIQQNANKEIIDVTPESKVISDPEPEPIKAEVKPGHQATVEEGPGY